MQKIKLVNSSLLKDTYSRVLCIKFINSLLYSFPIYLLAAPFLFVSLVIYSLVFTSHLIFPQDLLAQEGIQSASMFVQSHNIPHKKIISPQTFQITLRAIRVTGEKSSSEKEISKNEFSEKSPIEERSLDNLNKEKIEGDLNNESTKDIALLDNDALKEAASNTPTKEIVLEDDLEFLRGKLIKLPYAKFNLIAKQSDYVKPKSMKIFNLNDGQSVNVQPIEVSSTDGVINNVTVWLRWTGSDGMEILDTRIRLAPDETMLAGIEEMAWGGENEAAAAVPSSNHNNDTPTLPQDKNKDIVGTVLAITVSPQVVQSVE